MIELNTLIQLFIHFFGEQEEETARDIEWYWCWVETRF